MSNNGYEFALALLAISAALAFSGGGKLSLDRRLTDAQERAGRSESPSRAGASA